ncbi:MAG: sigma-70 family RNA polymerase sigma factor [Actinobacteria bacterium]|nr:MAG: sigma-70 family RNA polymerase sigma factor [Actinomycetota bacterium]
MTDRAHDDVVLIERYLAGDVAAFDELMRAHEDRVFAICMRMMRDREAALDAAQDTFLTVFRKADRFKAEAAFSTWLYRVAVNTCYDHLRRAQRRRTEAIPDEHEPQDPGTASDLTSVELRRDVEAALMALPPGFRAVIILVDMHGLSLEQAAEALEVPTGTVKSRLFRARKQLASVLGNLGPDREHRRDEAP